MQLPSHLKTCPICGAKLNLRSLGDARNTTCSQCEYVEPCGSAELITTASQVLAEYAIAKGVRSVVLGEGLGEIGIAEGVSPFCTLPLIATRANCYGSLGKHITKWFGDAKCFSEVGDPKAFFSARSIYGASGKNANSARYNLSQHLILLTYVIDEAKQISALKLGTTADRITKLHIEHLPYPQTHHVATQRNSVEMRDDAAQARDEHRPG